MNFRQLLNVAYAAIVEWMETGEREKFDRKLAADNPDTVGHGTRQLMGLMGVRLPPPPPRPAPAAAEGGS